VVEFKYFDMQELGHLNSSEITVTKSLVFSVVVCTALLAVWWPFTPPSYSDCCLIRAACPYHIALAWTGQKIPLPTIIPLTCYTAVT
jgi:hypothetical protein